MLTSGLELITAVLVVFIFVIIMLYKNKRMSGKIARAHDKVIELRERGIEAHICQKCKGKGEFGIWERDCFNLFQRYCNECGGVGYIYEEPPIKK